MSFPLRRTGVLLLVLVLCLAVLGVGYGRWSDTLTIRGDMTTSASAFQIGWVSCGSDDPSGGSLDPRSCDPTTKVPDADVFAAWDYGKNVLNSHYTIGSQVDGHTKDVAYTNCDLVTVNCTCPGGWSLRETAVVTVNNAYPGYICKVSLNAMNSGPSAAKVTSWVLETNDFETGSKFTCTYNTISHVWEWDTNPSSDLNPYNVGFSDSQQMTLQPCGTPEDFDLHIQIEQAAVQNTTDYSFTVTLIAEPV